MLQTDDRRTCDDIKRPCQCMA